MLLLLQIQLLLANLLLLEHDLLLLYTLQYQRESMLHKSFFAERTPQLDVTYLLLYEQIGNVIDSISVVDR